MRISPINTALLSIPALLLSSATGAGSPSLEARITNLEGRIAALEQRLATNDKATETAQLMQVSGGVGNSLSHSAALAIMANSA